MAFALSMGCFIVFCEHKKHAFHAINNRILSLICCIYTFLRTNDRIYQGRTDGANPDDGRH